jgi:hypothetical protein
MSDEMNVTSEPIVDYDGRDEDAKATPGPAENQEGKSLNELAGAGEIAAPATEEQIMAPVDFKTGCQGMRADIELIKSKVKNWRTHPEIIAVTGKVQDDDHPTPTIEQLTNMCETAENLVLCYRHLEDARMRIGKALQAHAGGVSIFDKPAS